MFNRSVFNRTNYNNIGIASTITPPSSEAEEQVGGNFRKKRRLSVRKFSYDYVVKADILKIIDEKIILLANVFRYVVLDIGIRAFVIKKLNYSRLIKAKKRFHFNKKFLSKSDKFFAKKYDLNLNANALKNIINNYNLKIDVGHTKIRNVELFSNKLISLHNRIMINASLSKSFSKYIKINAIKNNEEIMKLAFMDL